MAIHLFDPGFISQGATGASSLNATEENDTLAGVAKVKLTTSLSATEENDTLAGVAKVKLTASLSATEENDTLAGVAKVKLTASLSATEENDTLAATATVSGGAINSSLNATEENDTLAGVAKVKLTASLNTAEQDDTLAATATRGAAANNDNLMGGGSLYVFPYQRQAQRDYERKNAEEKRQELQLLNDELAQAEAVIQAAHDAQTATNEMAAIAAQEMRLQDEIDRLRIKRVWLMRLIDDEEALFVLQLCQPFH